MTTYSPKASEIDRAWHLIDADGLVLGRLCTEVARILRGKHKTVFAPHLDMGDHVVIINASKIVLTSGKAEKTWCIHTVVIQVACQARHMPSCWHANLPMLFVVQLLACCQRVLSVVK